MAQGNGNYHIYIHQTKEVIHKRVATNKISFGSGNGNTKPSSPRGSGKSSRIPSSIPGSGVANSVLQLVKNGASVGGVIGVAIAVVKATEHAQKAVGKLAEQTASQTGDYTWTTWWNNMATTQHNVMHPLSSFFQAQQTEANWARANKKVEEQRSLLGDTAINTLTKGV